MTSHTGRHRLLGCLIVAVMVTWVVPAVRAFTYQGELRDTGEPVTSADLVFELYGVATGGAPLTIPVVLDDVAVTRGRFTVTVDFGDIFDGADRWLQVSVRAPHDPDGTSPYTTLVPRQPVTPTPLAMHAANGATGDEGNTLDQAYDEGGPGAGATVSADAGPLHVGGPDGLSITQSLAIGATEALTPLHVSAGTDAAPAGGGFIQFGPGNGPNVAIDNNEIMARDNGAAATLFLNNDGGDVIVNGVGGGRLAVGSQNPTQRMHVAGALHVAGTGTDLSWPPGQQLQLGTWNGGTFTEYVEARTLNGGPHVMLRGPNGHALVRLRNLGDNQSDQGWLGVEDAQGAIQASLFVSSLGNGGVYGDIKNFRADNPRDPGTEIWYASVEGPEAAVYARGTAVLMNGRATVNLPTHFQDVAAAEGMTARVTPRSAASLGLAVTGCSTSRIEVRELRRGDGHYEFDWIVKAVRTGHQDYQVIRPRLTATSAPLPAGDEVTDAALRARRATDDQEVDDEQP